MKPATMTERNEVGRGPPALWPRRRGSIALQRKALTLT